MKIAAIECLPVKIPGHPYVGGHDDRRKSSDYGDYIEHSLYRSIYIRDAQSLLVKITTDDGIVGWGETQSTLVPQVVAQVVEELVSPGLLGQDPRDCRVLRDRLYDRFRERGHDSGLIVDAIAACDIALWDICGKASGLPVFRLLGGSYRETVPCYVSGVSAVTVGEQIEKMQGWLDRGFHRFKISLGYGVARDADHIRQLRAAFGDTVELMVDIHWRYNLSESIRLGRAFEEAGVAFMECPMVPELIEAHAQLCAALDLPIALGEEFRTRYRFKERLERSALDLAQPDIGRLGITEGMRVVELCSAWDLPVAPHIGAGLGVYAAATLHVAAAASLLQVLEYQPTQIDLADTYFAPSICPQSGAYALPDRPGLGLEPNEEELRKYLFS